MTRAHIMKKIFFQFFVKRHYCQDMSRPIKILNVAEKNDAAKNISALLSAGNVQRVSKDTSICSIKWRKVKFQDCDFYLEKSPSKKTFRFLYVFFVERRPFKVQQDL